MITEIWASIFYDSSNDCAGRHAYSRGTWTAAECMSLDSSQSATGYATPSQTIVPIMLKYLMVFEDPLTKTLWLGKALPRVWLAGGMTAGVKAAPTRYGRVAFAITADAADETKLTASLTLANASRWPPGGVRLRVRAPAFATGKTIASVTVGGQSWPHFNASAETVDFATAPQDLAALGHIVVRLG